MTDKTHSLSDQIRSGVKGIHGVGEAIRGTAMQATDEIFNSPEGAAKNKVIADRGAEDARQADNVIGHNHGIKANNTTTVPTSTGAGAHSTAPGNIGTTGATTATGAANTTVVQEQPGVNQRF